MALEDKKLKICLLLETKYITIKWINQIGIFIKKNLGGIVSMKDLLIIVGSLKRDRNVDCF